MAAEGLLACNCCPACFHAFARNKSCRCFQKAKLQATKDVAKVVASAEICWPFGFKMFLERLPRRHRWFHFWAHICRHPSGHANKSLASSEHSARRHVSALCWPIRCSGFVVFVQERCQLVACLHLCCLVGCGPSSCERSIQKRDVNGGLKCVVNLVLFIAPAPYTLARGELFGKNLLQPVLQAHHRGLALKQLSLSLRFGSWTCRAGGAQVQLLTETIRDTPGDRKLFSRPAFKASEQTKIRTSLDGFHPETTDGKLQLWILQISYSIFYHSHDLENHATLVG